MRNKLGIERTKSSGHQTHRGIIKEEGSQREAKGQEAGEPVAREERSGEGVGGGSGLRDGRHSE